MLKNRFALITGGTGALGSAIVGFALSLASDRSSSINAQAIFIDRSI